MDILSIAGIIIGIVGLIATFYFGKNAIARKINVKNKTFTKGSNNKIENNINIK